MTHGQKNIKLHILVSENNRNLQPSHLFS